MPEDSKKNSVGDIGRQQVGTIYAKALLGATEKTASTDDVLVEFGSLVHDALDRFPGLDDTLSSPRVPAEEKTLLLDRVFGTRMSESLLIFLKVVCAHGRLDCLREIYQSALRQVNELRGLIEVQLTTAEPVDRLLVGQITDVLQKSLGRQVLLRETYDADLIGGMVVRVGDKIYDGSVANRLAQLRTEALDRTVQEIRGATARFTSGD
jgi:F-type H+-transporting ATPase subunit delta